LAGVEPSPVLADPKTNLVFKRPFGAEVSKPLLNHLRELDGERPIPR
jgi:hypothetical protein